jgi:DNA (cytosine-5)-methyltransferase 1
MKHGSLFSGIGGIDLGFRWAGIETIWQVERDRFCLRTLEKNFPEAKRFQDVRECGKRNLEEVDVISGGFPCQDISVAGNMAGLEGEQSRLWFEQARIIRELRPAWVFVENVAQLLNSGGDRVLSEMEGEGYRTWSFVLGARTVGATHLRRRAWILGQREHAGGDRAPAAGVGALPEEAARAMAGAIAGWNRRAAELAAGTSQVGSDAYARIARDRHGVSDWLDRHHALGNAVVPQIPMLFGCFIRQTHEAALSRP